MISQLRPALTIFALLSLLTGAVYPVLVTGIAQSFFAYRADGSVMMRDGKPVGSELIGQPFDDVRYFWGRPSATEKFSYNAASLGASNAGPTNEDWLKDIAKRVEETRKAHPDQDQAAPVPVDLVTASASGLDPHISPAAAEYQVTRVAKERGMAVDDVRKLVIAHTERRTVGLLGEPRVHVLKLNLALDAHKN